MYVDDISVESLGEFGSGMVMVRCGKNVSIMSRDDFRLFKLSYNRQKIHDFTQDLEKKRVVYGK